MKVLVLATSFALALGVELFAIDAWKGETLTIIKETNGTTSTTNYVGFAKVTENNAASTNDAVWMIVRTILDASGNETSVQHAYGSGTGGNAIWSTAWTNRAAATYK